MSEVYNWVSSFMLNHVHKCANHISNSIKDLMNGSITHICWSCKYILYNINMNFLFWILLRNYIVSVFLISLHGAPLAQRDSYLLHSSLFGADYIVTNRINILLFGSRSIPNGAHTNHFWANQLSLNCQDTMLHNYKNIIMTCRAIPMIAFPRVRCMFIYIYIYIYSCVTNASMRCIHS